jgi:hypothetical protein
VRAKTSVKEASFRRAFFVMVTVVSRVPHYSLVLLTLPVTTTCGVIRTVEDAVQVYEVVVKSGLFLDLTRALTGGVRADVDWTLVCLVAKGQLPVVSSQGLCYAPWVLEDLRVPVRRNEAEVDGEVVVSLSQSGVVPRQEAVGTQAGVGVAP